MIWVPNWGISVCMFFLTFVTPLPNLARTTCGPSGSRRPEKDSSSWQTGKRRVGWFPEAGAGGSVIVGRRKAAGGCGRDEKAARAASSLRNRWLGWGRGEKEMSILDGTSKLLEMFFCKSQEGSKGSGLNSKRLYIYWGWSHKGKALWLICWVKSGVHWLTTWAHGLEHITDGCSQATKTLVPHLGSLDAADHSVLLIKCVASNDLILIRWY